jgi:hypothetical protein
LIPKAIGLAFILDLHLLRRFDLIVRQKGIVRGLIGPVLDGHACSFGFETRELHQPRGVERGWETATGYFFSRQPLSGLPCEKFSTWITRNVLDSIAMVGTFGNSMPPNPPKRLQ